MGKGSRNRQSHQNKVVHAKKNKKKFYAPKWLNSAIAIVIAAAVLIGIVAAILVDNGVNRRGRTLLESKSGKFDVNQQMATYMAWQNLYYQGLYYWSLSSQMGDSSIQKQYEQDEYALMMASTLSANLRDGIDDVVDQIKTYVAFCDAAYERGITLDDSDRETIQATIDELKGMKDGTMYATVSFSTFLEDIMAPGMRESDVEDALEIMMLYSKYSTLCKSELEQGVNADIMAAYRDQNPASFYNIGYLTFNADTKAFAEELKACTSIKEFKEKILNHHFDENYKGYYNKYTTVVTATEELNSLSNKTGDAWTEAKNAITGWDATTDYTDNADNTLPVDVKTWMFDSARKQYETTVKTTDTTVYLITLETVADANAAAGSKTVKAHIKQYAMVEGAGYGDDQNFKANILADLLYYKNNELTKPEVSYKAAYDKATDLETELKKENADITALLTAAGALSSTLENVTIPKAVTDAVNDRGVQKYFTVEDANHVAYTVSIYKEEGKTVEYYYAKFESDLYYKILDDLKTSLDKIYPAEKTAAYDADAKADSFGAWASAKGEGLTFTRKENDTAFFENKKTENNVETVTYDAYIITKAMDYKKTDKVVHGAYYQFTGDNAAANAEAAKADVAGKTYAELISAMANIGATTSQTAGIKESAVTDAATKQWLFADGRVANEVAVIDGTATGSKCLVAFVEKLTEWESAAKIGYVKQEFEAMEKNLVAGYEINQKVLEKIGEPSTTAATTAATTTAATTAAPAAPDLNG